ncbi:MAG: hypothetical protein R2695_21870 [Acidimicrobiales bacterium]
MDLLKTGGSFGDDPADDAKGPCRRAQIEFENACSGDTLPTTVELEVEIEID